MAFTCLEKTRRLLSAEDYAQIKSGYEAAIEAGLDEQSAQMQAVRPVLAELLNARASVVGQVADALGDAALAAPEEAVEDVGQEPVPAAPVETFPALDTARRLNNEGVPAAEWPPEAIRAGEQAGMVWTDKDGVPRRLQIEEPTDTVAETSGFTDGTKRNLAELAQSAAGATHKGRFGRIEADGDPIAIRALVDGLKELDIKTLKAEYSGVARLARASNREQMVAKVARGLIAREIKADDASLSNAARELIDQTVEDAFAGKGIVETIQAVEIDATVNGVVDEVARVAKHADRDVVDIVKMMAAEGEGGLREALGDFDLEQLRAMAAAQAINIPPMGADLADVVSAVVAGAASRITSKKGVRAPEKTIDEIIEEAEPASNPDEFVVETAAEETPIEPESVDTVEEMTALLTRYGIDPELYGKGEAKSLNSLVDEIQSGEAQLVDRGGKLVRKVSSLALDVYVDQDGQRLKLYEDRQDFRDGRTRRRPMNASLREKLEPGEDPQETIARALKEEIGVDIFDQIDGITSSEESRVSSSYPGLLGDYLTFSTAVELDPSQYQQEYREEQTEKVNVARWFPVADDTTQSPNIPGSPLNMARREAAARARMDEPDYAEATSFDPARDTSKVPGFWSDAWKATRRYNIPTSSGATREVGFDAAVDYLYNKAIEDAGGAERGRQAYILIGLPGAGKSTVADPVGSQFKAVHSSADEAKKIIPEFEDGANSAGVHEESSELGKLVLGLLRADGYNIVLEKLGGTTGSIEKELRFFANNGYASYLVHVDVPKAVAMERAIGRFERTGRAVPADTYGLDILKTYTILKGQEGVAGNGRFEWVEPQGWRWSEAQSDELRKLEITDKFTGRRIAFDSEVETGVGTLVRGSRREGDDQASDTRLPEGNSEETGPVTPALSVSDDITVDRAPETLIDNLIASYGKTVSKLARKYAIALEKIGTDNSSFFDIKAKLKAKSVKKAELDAIAWLYGQKKKTYRLKALALEAIEAEFNRRAEAETDVATLAGEQSVITRDQEDKADARRRAERDRRNASLGEGARALSDGGIPTGLLQDEEGGDAGGSPDGRGRGSLRPVQPDDVGDTGATEKGRDNASDGEGEQAGTGASDRQRNRDERRYSSAAAVEAAEKAEADRKARRRENYKITDEDGIGAGGPKVKVKANLAAIKIIRALEDENRSATPEEKKALVKYVGWGAFAQDVFADHKPEWAKERQQLRDLLSAEEYEAARASVLNAHYTSKDVIDGMWGALEHLGFTGGKAIEPSAGIGHFIGLTPDAIRAKTDWTAVELDQITGRIAKELYSGSDVRISGFEKTAFPDNFFDLAISNVPFSDVAVAGAERKYAKLSLHDYFFARSLDKVRPGGLVAFITSRFTMDKQTTSARRLMAEKADLVGAIRLPGGNKGAFAGNAGTAVTTDILFLRKKIPGEPVREDAPKWIETVEIKTPEGPTPVNEYFAANPDMMLGKMRLTGTQWRKDEPVLIGPTNNLNERILKAAEQMPESVFAERGSTTADIGTAQAELSADGIKEGALFLKGGKVYQNVIGEAIPQKAGGKTLKRLRMLIGIRDIVNDLLAGQASGKKDESADHLRGKLNTAYDAFVKAFGPIGKVNISKQVRKNKDGTEKEIVTRRYPNLQGFDVDPDVYKVTALEAYDDETGKAAKTGIFTGDIIAAYTRPDVAGPADAIAVSLNETGTIDIPRIAEMLNVTDPEAIAAVGDRAFLNPNGGKWDLAEIYLSGDVVTKLEEAKAAAVKDPQYERNVRALEDAQPAPLSRVDIRTTFGAPWIPAEVYNEFNAKVIGLRNGDVKFEPITSRWVWDIKPGYKAASSPAAQEAYGTKRVSAHEIILAALNDKPLRVTDPVKNGDGSTSQVVNVKDTEDVEVKLKLVREAFTGDQNAGIPGWAFEDEARAQKLEAIYNTTFNRLVPTKYDGSHLELPGLAKTLTLPNGKTVPLDRSPHRVNVVWRAILTGNVLMDHAVGSGKTISAIAATQEMKRLGLIQRPMFAVPNHMLEQFSREFLQAYPNAKLLVADKKNMEAKNRKAFAARIASDRWDGIIITHSAFGRVSMKNEAYVEFLKEEIDEAVQAYREALAAEDKKSPTVKTIERKKKSLEARLAKLLAKENKDDGVTFEELGVDYLVIDEAHMFKNLDYSTRHGNVKGVGVKGSQRATDLFLKIQHIEKSRPGRSAMFMTGTPMSRSMAEIYTMQRYLQNDLLKEYGIAKFDAWAATFGQITTQTEIAPNGRTFKETTSFSKFVNVPELQALYSRVADSLTADDLNLPRPDLKGGKIDVVEAELSEADEMAILDTIDKIDALKGPAQKGEDNHLSLFTRGLQISTDMRLVDPDAEFNPNGKIAKLVSKVSEIYKAGAAPALAQMIFLDMGTPSGAGKPKKVKGKAKVADIGDSENQIDLVRAKLADDTDEDIDSDQADREAIEDSLRGKINLYQDIKDRLVAQGIPAKEIAFIHDAKTDTAKANMFKAVREGKIRIILGSSAKMGVGTNVQRYLTAMHHVDAPWNPADVVQRDGRILRRGNENKEVSIFRYITKRSFEAYRWQLLDRKAQFEAQFRAGARGMREAEDIDSPLPEAADLKAAASGDPRIMEYAELTKEIRELEAARRGNERSYIGARQRLAETNEYIAEKVKWGARYDQDATLVTDLTGDKFEMRLDLPSLSGKVKSRKKAGEAIRDHIMTQMFYHYGSRSTNIELGSISGFKVSARGRTSDIGKIVTLNIEGAALYEHHGGAKVITAESDPVGLVKQIENLVKGVPQLAAQNSERLAALMEDKARLEKQAVPTPFARALRLAEAKARHEELERALKGLKEKAEEDSGLPKPDADVEPVTIDEWVDSVEGLKRKLNSGLLANPVPGRNRDAEDIEELPALVPADNSLLKDLPEDLLDAEKTFDGERTKVVAERVKRWKVEADAILEVVAKHKGLVLDGQSKEQLRRAYDAMGELQGILDDNVQTAYVTHNEIVDLASELEDQMNALESDLLDRESEIESITQELGEIAEELIDRLPERDEDAIPDSTYVSRELAPFEGFKAKNALDIFREWKATDVDAGYDALYARAEELSKINPEDVADADLDRVIDEVSGVNSDLMAMAMYSREIQKRIADGVIDNLNEQFDAIREEIIDPTIDDLESAVEDLNEWDDAVYPIAYGSESGDDVSALIERGTRMAGMAATLPQDDGTPFVGEKEARYREDMRVAKLKMRLIRELTDAGRKIGTSGAGLGADRQGGIAAPGAQGSQGIDGGRQGGDAIGAKLSDPGFREAALDAFLSAENKRDAIAARAEAQGFTTVGVMADVGRTGALVQVQNDAKPSLVERIAQSLQDMNFMGMGQRAPAPDSDRMVRVRVSKPLVLPAIGQAPSLGDPRAVMAMLEHPKSNAPEGLKRWARKFAGTMATAPPRAQAMMIESGRFASEISKELTRLGYDGVRVGDNLMVWDQANVRSAYDFFHADAENASGLMASEAYVEQDLQDRLAALMKDEGVDDGQEVYSFAEMGRDLDALGYYSKALEAAKGLKQEKGTPEQMLAAMNGIKQAELEMTGLREFLSGKASVTKAEIVEYLRANRVGLSEVDRSREDGNAAAVAQETERRIQEWEESERAKAEFEEAKDYWLADDYIERNAEEWVSFARNNGLVVDDDAVADQPRNALETAGITFRFGSIPIWDDTNYFVFGTAPNGQSVEYDSQNGFEVIDGSIDDGIKELEAAALSFIERDIVSADPFERRREIRQDVEAEFDAVDPTKFSNYSLDPSNPTYRETVLHLPANADNRNALKAMDGLPMTQENLSRAARLADFQSGHFPEPNIIGHMMTSIVHAPGNTLFRVVEVDGEKHVDSGPADVFLIDQIQSDWGQRLRDGGVRDEAKIAELKAQEADLNNKARDLVIRVSNEWGERRPSGHHGSWLSAIHNKLTPEAKETALAKEIDAFLPEYSRVLAELRTAEAATPGNPMVNTTDQWTNTTLRRALTQAVAADADYIAIPFGDTVLSYNPGDTNGMREFYGHNAPSVTDNRAEGIVPKNLRKILGKLDKDASKPVLVDQLETPTQGMKGKGFTLFPITDTIKQKVRDEGQEMFSLAPPAERGNLRLTPEAKAEYPAIAAALEKRLRTMLPADVGVKFAHKLFSTNGQEQYGRFRPSVKVMELALAYGPQKAMQIGAHEVVHVLREAGAFTDAEWTSLVERAKKTGVEDDLASLKSDYERIYRAQANRMPLSEEARSAFVARRIEEELVAKLAERHFAPQPTTFGARIDRLLQRMADILDAIVGAFNGQGFTDAASVFSRMERGKIAERVEPAGPRAAPWTIAKTDVDDQRAVAGLFALADGDNVDIDTKISNIQAVTDFLTALKPERRKLTDKLDVVIEPGRYTNYDVVPTGKDKYGRNGDVNTVANFLVAPARRMNVLGVEVTNARVVEEYQRQGIATAVYDMIDTDMKAVGGLSPAEQLSDQARSMWGKRLGDNATFALRDFFSGGQREADTKTIKAFTGRGTYYPKRFDAKRTKSAQGVIFFSTRTETANLFAQNDGKVAALGNPDLFIGKPQYKEGGMVYPVDITGANLFDQTNAEHRKMLLDAIGDDLQIDSDKALRTAVWSQLEAPNIVKAIERLGFDGWISSEIEPQDTIAMFEKGLVKSSITGETMYALKDGGQSTPAPAPRHFTMPGFEGTATTQQKYDGLRTRVYTIATDGAPVASVALSEREPELWEVIGVNVIRKSQGKGIAPKVLKAIEEDLGRDMLPDGIISDVTYANTLQSDPNRVRNHVNGGPAFDGLYLSPGAVEMMRSAVNDASEAGETDASRDAAKLREDLKKIEATIPDTKYDVERLANEMDRVAADGVDERKARAEAMGFDTSTVWYHGSRRGTNIDSFDLSRTGDSSGTDIVEGVWLTSDWSEADRYGRMADARNSREEFSPQTINRFRSDVIDVYAPSSDRLYVFDVAAERRRLEAEGVVLPGASQSEALGVMDDWLPHIVDEAKRQSKDGVYLLGIEDNPLSGWGYGKPSNHIIIFDPSNIRSVNAKFDPTRSDDTDIMSALKPRSGGAPSHLVQIGDVNQSGVNAPSAGLSDLVDMVQEALGFESRLGKLNPGLKAQMGRLGAKLYGQFSRQTGLARIAIPNDLGTLVHEGGHRLEIHPDLAGNVEAIKQSFSAELMPLAGPGVDQLSEGWAEFFRLYVVDPARAANSAPQTMASFRAMLENRAPEMLVALEAIQAGVSQVTEASPAGALLSRVKSTKQATTTVGKIREEVAEKGTRNAISDRLYAATRDIVDSKHPMLRARDFLLSEARRNMEAAKTITKDQVLFLKGLYDPYKLARMLEHSRVHATSVLKYGVRFAGRSLAQGPSMQDVLALAFGGKERKLWNDEMFQKFGAYLVSRRMNAEWDRFDLGELEGPPDHLMKRDVWGRAQTDIETAYPQFKQAAALLDQFQMNLLQWKREKGFLTEDQYLDFKSRDGYAPLNRIMEDAGVSSLNAAAQNNKRGLVFRFKGSTRDFINPLESIIADVYTTQSRVELNDMIGALRKAAAAAGPNGGKIAEVIPSHDMRAKDLNLKPITDRLRAESEKLLEKAISSGAIESWDASQIQDSLDTLFDQHASQTLFSAVEINDAGQRIVYHYENGKRTPILLGQDDLGRDLFEMIAAVGKPVSNEFWFDGAVLFTQFFRAGVTKSPPYIIVNWFRDQLATWVLSRDFTPGWTGFKGLRDVIQGNDASQRYQEWAGMMGGIDSNIIDTMGRGRDALQLRKSGYFAAPTTWQSIMRTMEITEAGTRVGHMDAVYKRMISEGFSEEEAAFEAAYVSHDVMDFSRHGSKMMQASRLVAFLNAQLQGMSVALRTGGIPGLLPGKRENYTNIQDAITPYIKASEGMPLSVGEKEALPMSTKFWLKLVSIGMIGLGLSLMYRDDPEYEELTKSQMGHTHWFFKIGGTWWRAPKPFELAVFSNLFEAMFAKVAQNDELAEQRFLRSLRETMLLSPEMQAFGGITTLGRTFLTGPMDKLTGKMQYDRHNDNLPMRLRGLPPELQWDAYTSEFSKLMAGTFGISPYKTDNVIRSLFASVGRDALTVGDYILPRVNQSMDGALPGVATTPRADKSFEDYIFLSRITRRSARGAYSTWQFWQDMSMDNGRLTTAANGYKRLMDEGGGRQAQQMLNGMDDETKAYTLLEYYYQEKDEDMHPMNRAKQVIGVMSNVRKEMAEQQLYKAVTKKKGRELVRITLPPSTQRVVNEILEDLSLREARNAQIILGKPGWVGREEMPTDGLMKELRAASPDVADEVEYRMTHGAKKTYPYAGVKAAWPKVREHLLNEDYGSSLAKFRGEAKYPR